MAASVWTPAYRRIPRALAIAGARLVRTRQRSTHPRFHVNLWSLRRCCHCRILHHHLLIFKCILNFNVRTPACILLMALKCLHNWVLISYALIIQGFSLDCWPFYPKYWDIYLRNQFNRVRTKPFRKGVAYKIQMIDGQTVRVVLNITNMTASIGNQEA